MLNRLGHLNTQLELTQPKLGARLSFALYEKIDMKEETIIQVANILNTWNPLSEKSKSINDLEQYYYEAIDIISTVNLMSGENEIEKAISQVLEQAFGIVPPQEEVLKAATKIKSVLVDKNLN